MKPPALRPGDKVGIVAPASNIKRPDLDAGCDALRRVGYDPFYFDSILDQDLYFAGSVDRRVRELEDMFARDDVRAVLCARGGYGANYLLNHLDLGKIKAHPKPFIGYSDLTCLMTHLTDAGLVTFHGPMAAKDWAHEDGIDFTSWQSALSANSAWDVPLNPEVRGLADGGRYPYPADSPHRPQYPYRQCRHGHRDGIAPGDCPGAARWHRDHPPQHVHCPPGHGSGQGETLGKRHDC